MSATAMTSPWARQLERIWRGLPDGQLSAREVEEAILMAAGREDSGDYALASAIRSSLVAAQALIGRPGERSHEFTYERSATFPEWPVDNGPGSTSYNVKLKRQHEQHELEMQAHDRRQAEALANSPLGVERRQLLELIDRRVTERVNEIVDQRIGELLRSLEAPAVSRLRQRLAEKAGADRPKETESDV